MEKKIGTGINERGRLAGVRYWSEGAGELEGGSGYCPSPLLQREERNGGRFVLCLGAWMLSNQQQGIPVMSTALGQGHLGTLGTSMYGLH